MNDEERQLVKEATSILCTDDDSRKLYEHMTRAYELARKGVPVRLTGRSAVMNPLIDLMLSDHDTYEAVLQYIVKKRDALGQPPLEDSDQVRRDYMREMMVTRRARLSRLVDLWNSMRPEREKLRGKARMEFERVHGNRWFAARGDRELTMREQVGRRLTHQERTNMLISFWKEVDSELDDLEEFARNQMRAGAQRTNVFQFKIQPRKDKNERA